MLALDVALHAAPGLHHEDDHADHEDGGDQHHPAFHDVGIQVQPRDQDGSDDAADDGGDEPAVNVFAQLGAADLVQIGEGNADNKGCFHSFAEGNDKGLDHASGTSFR